MSRMWGIHLGHNNSSPVFVQQLPGNIGEIEENTALHLECKVEPFGDDTLSIQWFHNGLPLKQGHRFRTFADFGLVSLDILNVYAEDSGNITCVAENAHGRAQTSAEFYCYPKSSILDQTKLPASVARIQQLEAPKGPFIEEEPEIVYKPAHFITPLSGSIKAAEGESVSFTAKAGPVEDNTLTHEWYFNNHPLMHANRFVTSQEFGVITMNILYLFPEDSGTYTLMVRNNTGQAHSTVDITVASNSSMITETFHPKSVNRILEIEAPKPEVPEVPDAEKVVPKITKVLESVPKCKEGTEVYVEARYTPTDDNQVIAEWYFNGTPIKHSNRHVMVHNPGHVSLVIRYTFVEDSGEYTLMIKNSKGQAQTSTKLEVEGGVGILGETMHPKSLGRIQEIEMPKPLPEEAKEKPVEPPKFTRGLQMVLLNEFSAPNKLQEGDAVKIDCTVSPVTDNQLRIEWLFNNYPLLHSNRMKMTNDLGYVSLEFPHICARDSGEYTCRAVSPHGTAEARIQLDVAATPSMFLNPQHEKSWRQIEAMENTVVERPPTPVLQYQAPSFTVGLANIKVTEGDTVVLQCKIQPVNDPSLRISWKFNAKNLFEASRHRHKYNVNDVILEIQKAVAEDSGTYECNAISSNGETSTQCDVIVEATDSLLLHTQNERTWSKIQELEAPQDLPEAPEVPFSAPKFTKSLESVKTLENESILLQTRIQPHDDPSLTVTWLKDGAPVSGSNRVHLVYQFGSVGLQIAYCRPTDAGEYTVVVANKQGTVTQNCKVEVEAIDNVVDTVQHEQSWTKIQQLEAPKELVEEVEDDKKFGTPSFVVPLQSVKDVAEGTVVKLEAKVKPANDANLMVVWYQNGRLLGASNRYIVKNELGKVSLEILYVMEQDAGDYRCVATNSAGQASTEAKLECSLRPSVLSDTQHQKALDRIQELEAPKPEKPEIEPVFLVQPRRMNCFMKKDY
ncbi:unnamed protein product [Bursaphelenchus okinawaensis]|uniref:Ig-like domain-containing protein n=1 Tax=Bursaphelenchus okinawaensis TaxID=465554 RepID=A0A811LE67_9BILA|nr:unnamed protein product [Bursaphelenchus okinawaensis]CAG9121573.1 unnamed protein product [Bursaphelenchus okinawaensis]